MHVNVMTRDVRFVTVVEHPGVPGGGNGPFSPENKPWEPGEPCRKGKETRHRKPPRTRPSRML